MTTAEDGQHNTASAVWWLTDRLSDGSFIIQSVITSNIDSSVVRLKLLQFNRPHHLNSHCSHDDAVSTNLSPIMSCWQTFSYIPQSYRSSVIHWCKNQWHMTHTGQLAGWLAGWLTQLTASVFMSVACYAASTAVLVRLLHTWSHSFLPHHWLV